jgi:hypothetical protein
LRLHSAVGTRLIGFDNAHGVATVGTRHRKRQPATDHWHRTEGDPGRSYRFKDAATLIEDFFNEVELALTGRGVPVRVIFAEDKRSKA